MIKFSYILTVYDLNFHFITYFCHIFNLDQNVTICLKMVFLHNEGLGPTVMKVTVV